MLPTWVGVVSALSLAVIALAAIVVAAASIASALGVRTLVRVLEQLAGPALTDVRQLIATIKGEADALAGTSRDIRLRIVRAADAAEARLTDLDALVEVVQEEVEETVIDAAVTLQNVRRGLSLWQWGKKVLKRKRKRP
jgi:anthranilate phosphoribosyltransferase